jgi:hypothetical protein
MMENILVGAFTLTLLLVMYGIFWVSLMLGSFLYGVVFVVVALVAWLGAHAMRNHMKKRRILRHGTPGRVRVSRVESNSLLYGDDYSSYALTVEVLEGGPRRTITFNEYLDIYCVPEVGDELDVLFDVRSLDLAIIRPD